MNPIKNPCDTQEEKYKPIGMAMTKEEALRHLNSIAKDKTPKSGLIMGCIAIGEED